MSTIKAAVELKQTFDQIAAAEKSGSLSPDEKRKLEESAAEKVHGPARLPAAPARLTVFPRARRASKRYSRCAARAPPPAVLTTPRPGHEARDRVRAAGDVRPRPLPRAAARAAGLPWPPVPRSTSPRVARETAHACRRAADHGRGAQNQQFLLTLLAERCGPGVHGGTKGGLGGGRVC